MAVDPEAYADDGPLEAERRVAGQSMWEALGALTPSVADVALRDGLRRWTFVLTEARILGPEDVSWAKLASAPSGRFLGDRPRQVSWREGWRGVAAARTSAEAALWVDSVLEAGPGLAAVARRRAERRVEVARRLGLSHPWSALVPTEPAALRRAASRFLAATDDLSRASWKETLGRDMTMAGVLHAAVGRDAPEGWPARLTPRWLEDVFGVAVRGLRIDLPALPAAMGAASFARALGIFGFAYGVAVAPPSMPFALAHDPAFVDAHRLAFVLGALASDPAWQVRVLGIAERAAHAQSRLMARGALLEARMHAVRLLLGDDTAFAPRELFDELGVRLFGAALPAQLAGAWPRARDDEAARFAALLEARGFAVGVRDRFDFDWYRNPRAWDDLRAPRAPGAPRSADAAVLEGQVDGLARAFDEVLG